ncbi:MAG: hypothetical protein ACFE9L_13185 [Candidatus Hodarchaeota archaeon]
MKNNIELLEKILAEIEQFRVSEQSFNNKEVRDLFESKHLKFFHIGFNSMRFCIKRIKRLHELYTPYDRLKTECLWNDLFECFHTIREYIKNHKELSSEKLIQERLSDMESLFLQLESNATLKNMLAMTRCSESSTILALRMIQNTHMADETKKKKN